MFKLIYKIFCYYLQRDESLRRAYKDNIAMYIYDNRRKDGRLNKEECNEVADGLLDYLFKN